MTILAVAVVMVLDFEMTCTLQVVVAVDCLVGLMMDVQRRRHQHWQVCCQQYYRGDMSECTMIHFRGAKIRLFL